MKKIYQTLSACLLALAIGNTATAQNFTTVTVQDSISSDTHWTADKQYLLRGYVYVTNGNTLTIDPGVVVRGDKQTKGALIVERGAKIMAMGTEFDPIVFTSNQSMGNRSYGDWGGIILCGKSPNNWASGSAQVEGGPRSLYGGTDPHDNSGEMHYVRIEYPGIAFSPNNEVNGLTFCSVGDATQIDHIQVSFSGDDSYEWFGGTVNTKNLVAFGTWDDDFDNDCGYAGFNQYGISLRDPYAADNSGSKAWESDSYQNGTKTGLSGNVQPTAPVFANYTVIGPLVQPGSTAYDPQFVAAAQMRRGSSMSILNSVIVGYPAGLLIDESDSNAFGSTIANLVSGSAEFKNNAIAGVQLNGAGGGKEVVLVYNGARSLTPTNLASPDTTGSGVFSFGSWTGPWNWLMDPANSNKIYATEQNGLRIQNPFNLTNPDFTPTSTSPISYNSKALPGYMTAGGTIDPFQNGKLYPYNPALPINTDTSGLFASYNAPNLLPNLTSTKLQNSFFTAENHIGAQNYNTAKWTANWTNFDPNNTDYDSRSSSTSVATYVTDKLYLQVSPNPAKDAAVIGYAIADNTDLNITLVDILGNNVRTILNEKNVAAGKYAFKFETAGLEAGVYFVNVTTPSAHSAIKLAITK
ncbi:MAG: hypothetical protein JWO03_342 [Bacteroidetes bacterium]|nr:hypothetical protein [Bacteroidota bacterium]